MALSEEAFRWLLNQLGAHGFSFPDVEAAQIRAALPADAATFTETLLQMDGFGPNLAPRYLRRHVYALVEEAWARSQDSTAAKVAALSLGSSRRHRRRCSIVCQYTPDAMLPSGPRIAMQFTKRLREPIMSGAVTCSVRIWRSPHVKVGGRYRLGPGAVTVTSIRKISSAT